MCLGGVVLPLGPVTTDRVEEGERVLGRSFDASHTLPLSHQEGWRLSQELPRLRSLLRELAQRRKDAEPRPDLRRGPPHEIVTDRE